MPLTYSIPPPLTLLSLTSLPPPTYLVTSPSSHCLSILFSGRFRPEVAGLISSMAVLLTRPSQGHAKSITPMEVIETALAVSRSLSHIPLIAMPSYLLALIYSSLLHPPPFTQVIDAAHDVYLIPPILLYAPPLHAPSLFTPSYIRPPPLS